MISSKKAPYQFDEFFASGKEETLSPFLLPSSRPWGRHLSLKGALLSAAMLAIFFAARALGWQVAPFFLVVVYALSGTPALLNALEDLKQWNINIDVLMTLAALLSVTIGSGVEGALLLVLFELSGAMEEAVTHKTKGALTHLNELTPKTAWLVTTAGKTVERSSRDINVGQKILVQAGEIVPLDGVVIEGSSLVSLAHLTGESLPLRKQKGDEIPAGGRCLDGSITLEVTRHSSDSTLARMIHLILTAQSAAPKLQRWIDKLDRLYATTIIVLFIAFAAFLPFLLPIPYLGKEGAIYRALTFLVAASPCALVLATPTAYLSAITSCARKGVLMKGGSVLDALASCRVAAFDKTGTLTTGELACLEWQQISGPTLSRKEVMAAAYALEQRATHPIAKALCRQATIEGIEPAPLASFLSLPGDGVEGSLQDGRSCRIGRPAWVRQQTKSDLPPPPPTASHRPVAELLIGESLFRFFFADQIRDESATTLLELRRRGLQLAMLTGDHSDSANEVAKQLGIDLVYSELSPEAKLDHVSRLSSESGLVMVGDGINDAAALARATVGISMGKIGSRAAIDASDVVFLQDNLASLPWAIHQAQRTLSIVRQNVSLALGVILLASTPALLGFIPLWLAVILHEGGTLLVGLNALRLLR